MKLSSGDIWSLHIRWSCRAYRVAAKILRSLLAFREKILDFVLWTKPRSLVHVLYTKARTSVNRLYGELWKYSVHSGDKWKYPRLFFFQNVLLQSTCQEPTTKLRTGLVMTRLWYAGRSLVSDHQWLIKTLVFNYHFCSQSLVLTLPQ